ncbi:TPA: antA/AntB antirepressor family protein [Serratia marcescens]
MNNQLIPVFNGSIADEKTLLCDARELHTYLGVRRDFSTWIKNRISGYGFIMGVDYIVVQNLRSPNLVSAKSRAQVVDDYHLTLDTAKELAMVERNEKGRQVRRYFIECEKRLRDESARERGQEAQRYKSPAHRYQATLIIKDNISGKTIKMHGQADTIKQVAAGISTDLGYEPVTVISRASNAQKALLG